MKHPQLAVAALLTSVAFLAEPIEGQLFDNTGATTEWFQGGPGPDRGGGQVVTTDAHNRYFSAFSFWVRAAETLNYRAHLALLYDPIASGPVSGFDGQRSPYRTIWSSEDRQIQGSDFSGATPDPLEAYQRVDFKLGVFLDPAARYAVYLTPEPRQTLYMASGFSEPDGVVTRGDQWTAWTDVELGFVGDDRFSAFRAEFSSRCRHDSCRSVPEPNTSLLMLSGLLGLGWLAWRRREAVT